MEEREKNTRAREEAIPRPSYAGSLPPGFGAHRLEAKIFNYEDLEPIDKKEEFST